MVKGRSHVAQKRFTDLKRLIDRDRKRRRDQGLELVARARAQDAERQQQRLSTRNANSVEKEARRQLWGSSASVSEHDEQGFDSSDDDMQSRDQEDNSALDPSDEWNGVEESTPTENHQVLNGVPRNPEEKKRNKKSKEKLVSRSHCCPLKLANLAELVKRISTDLCLCTAAQEEKRAHSFKSLVACALPAKEGSNMFSCACTLCSARLHCRVPPRPLRASMFESTLCALNSVKSSKGATCQARRMSRQPARSRQVPVTRRRVQIIWTLRGRRATGSRVTQEMQKCPSRDASRTAGAAGNHVLLASFSPFDERRANLPFHDNLFLGHRECFLVAI
jgi:hypothetical protein